MPTKLKLIFREPFVQFIVLGCLLFVFVYYLQQKKDKQSLEIIVGNEQVNLMIVNYKTQTGNLPTKQQLDAMIDNYIKEEISYREAKKMGLDKDDEIIRRRLSQKFDFLQTDLTEIAPPSEADLLKFYTVNPNLFQTEATVNFSHIYFSTDKSSNSLAKQKAVLVLQQLKITGLQRAPEKGDRFPLQYDYTEQSALDIRQNFGDKPLLDSLFSAPVHTWVGPVQSGYGWHLIYISKRAVAGGMAFNEVKEEVKIKYMEAMKLAQNKKAADKLREKYLINRVYLNTK